MFDTWQVDDASGETSRRGSMCLGGNICVGGNLCVGGCNACGRITASLDGTVCYGKCTICCYCRRLYSCPTVVVESCQNPVDLQTYTWPQKIHLQTTFPLLASVEGSDWICIKSIVDILLRWIAGVIQDLSLKQVFISLLYLTANNAVAKWGSQGSYELWYHIQAEVLVTILICFL